MMKAENVNNAKKGMNLNQIVVYIIIVTGIIGCVKIAWELI